MEALTLKQARNLRGMSRKAVADALGVDPSTIWNWETGKTYPDIPKFMKLCQLYGVSIDQIFLPSQSTI